MSPKFERKTPPAKSAIAADTTPAATTPPVEPAKPPAAPKSPVAPAKAAKAIEKPDPTAKDQEIVDFSSYITRGLHKRFKMKCIELDMQMVQGIEEAITQWLDRK